MSKYYRGKEKRASVSTLLTLFPDVFNLKEAIDE
jgi:hypothetical protein